MTVYGVSVFIIMQNDIIGYVYIYVKQKYIYISNRNRRMDRLMMERIPCLCYDYHTYGFAGQRFV